MITDSDIHLDSGEELLDVDPDGEYSAHVLKKVPCGTDCGGCPHGPYEFRVHREDEGLVWTYVGSA
jgi:hypothetical protein